MSDSIFDVKTFGAVGDGVTDDTGAFEQALAAIEALSPHVNAEGTVDNTRGAVLFVPFGKYVVTRTLQIRRQMVLQGVSGAGDYPGSALVFSPDIDGIVVDRQVIERVGTDKDGNPTITRIGHEFGDWTVIRDVSLESDSSHALSLHPNPSVNEDEPISASLPDIDHPPLTGHGVVLKSRARIVDCRIAGFHFDGVYIDTVDLVKNANNFEIHNCRITNNGRHGIFTAGDNSNAGRIVGVDCSDNAGWGVYDRSFLGNTYVGCHCSSNGHFATDVRCLLIDPTTTSLTYAGTADGGFYHASDGGRNWSAFNRGLGVGGFNVVVNALAQDPSDGRLYAGTEKAGVVRLTPIDWTAQDLTWKPVNSGLTNLSVRALVRVTSPAAFYAGTSGGGVFRSTDDAQSWTAANDGLDNLDVTVLAADPATGAIYAGTAGGGIFRSIDGARNWLARSDGLGDPNVAALAVDTTAATTIYAGTSSGVFRSTDQGQHWTTSLPGQQVAALAVDPTNPLIVYAGTKAGVLKSLDGGVVWTPMNTGFTTLDIQALAIDPLAPTTIYAGTHPPTGFNFESNLGGVYRSVDGGVTWHGGPQPPSPLPPDPENASRTYYGGGYKTVGADAGNVLVGCYSEADQVNGNELKFPTLVLGGALGGGFNAITDAGIIDKDGIANLPLRSPTVHKVRTIARKVSVPPIVPTTLEQDNVFPGDEVILIDLTHGSMVLVLSPPNVVSGNQFFIKVIANPNQFTVQIESQNREPIESGTVLTLDPTNSGVTLLSDGNTYRIVSTLGNFTLR
jgi:photosystem II stability/assembly factor-like uncharacterized protein